MQRSMASSKLAEGAMGIHNCRMRDLIPDTAGAYLGAIAVLIVRRLAAVQTPAGSNA